MNEQSKRFPRSFWAEKTICGEMWIGRFIDERAPDAIQATASYGDFDTAILHARIEVDKRRCTGFRRLTDR